MRNWAPTFPLLNRPLPGTRPVPADYEDWSVAELYAGERFPPSAPTALPPPASPPGAGAEAAVARSQPGWLADAQWETTPEAGSWPEPRPIPRSAGTEDPFERAAIRMRRRTPRRSPMGPPFLDEPPQDHPSHLGPVPRAPDWEQTVTGPTPWSPLAPPPRATDWGKILTGIECRRTEDGNLVNCITPGGLRVKVPAEDFPEYIGPGQPNYHYYNKAVGGARVDPSHLMQGVIDNPTPGPRYMVRPATPEGTVNEATPELVYNAVMAQAQQLPGMPFNSVKSFLTYDQNGRPVMVNVTRPGHQLAPGVVIRYVTTGPSGSTIQNEGAGLGIWQAPNRLPAAFGIPDSINNVWNDQSRAIIEEQLRRARR
jgi:hypothetical protein